MLASIFRAHKQKAQPVHAWGWQCLRHVEDRELGENRRGRGLPEAFGVLRARPRGFIWLPLSSVWCEEPAFSGLFSLVPPARDISGAALSLLWSVVNFYWLYRKEHFIEDGKVSETPPV